MVQLYPECKTECGTLTCIFSNKQCGISKTPRLRDGVELSFGDRLSLITRARASMQSGPSLVVNVQPKAPRSVRTRYDQRPAVPKLYDWNDCVNKEKDTYEALLREINGHEYTGNFGERLACYHEMHNAKPSVDCWRADVREFIDGQTCKSWIQFSEDGIDHKIACTKPGHHEPLDHEGVLSMTGGRYDPRVIRWSAAAVGKDG